MITVIAASVSVKVTSAGFDIEAARCALNFFGGNVQRVLNELLERNGEVPHAWASEFNEKDKKSE